MYVFRKGTYRDRLKRAVLVVLIGLHRNHDQSFDCYFDMLRQVIAFASAAAKEWLQPQCFDGLYEPIAPVGHSGAGFCRYGKNLDVLI